MRRIIISLILLVGCMQMMAEIIITGTVIDDTNAPVEGAQVICDDGVTTAVSNADGRFEITVDENAKLTFSSDGLSTLTLEAIDGMTATLQRIAAATQHPNSYIKLAIGHPQTMADAQYTWSDSRNNSLTLKADHQGQWGFRTLEWSAVSLDYMHSFKRHRAYFKLGGANLYFTRYGRYYIDSTATYTIPKRIGALQNSEKQNMWRATATAGLQTVGERPLQYKAEILYQLYTFWQMMTEYQCNFRFDISYHTANQTAGAHFFNENHFTLLSETTQAYYDEKNLTLNPVHCVRIEPYYEYKNERVTLHAGVNLDLNVGRGNLFSHTDNSTPLARQIAFAPSPNVRLEVQMVPQKAMLYADVLGSFGTSSMTGYVKLNPYIGVKGAPSSHHVSSYIPVDSKLGIQLRPINGLLLQLETGYRYVLNSAECSVSESSEAPTSWNMMGILYTDFQRWKTGASVRYHYQNYFSMHLSADYYFYRGVKNNTSGTKVGAAGAQCYTEGRIYDRPLWEVSLRLEGHINSHWSVYTDNTLKGSRWAITSLGDRQLPAFIDMNLGAGYQFGGTRSANLDRLYLFAELQNILNRRNMVWYGYESEGIHGRIGFSYKL